MSVDTELSTQPEQDDSLTQESECPPPLMWQEVLAAVRRDIEKWELERNGAVVSGVMFGEGSPLLFVNNVWGDWEIFALTMWLLREEFRCIVLNWPQKQDGKLPTARLGLADLSADLIAAADHQHVDRFAIFATSFGTLPAIHAAAEANSRITKLALHAAFAHYRLSLSERLLLRLGRLMKRPLKRLPFFERMQTWNHRSWLPPFDGTRWNYLLNNIGGTPTRDVCRRIVALRKTRLDDMLSQVNAPTLLLHGEGSSRAVRERSAELAQKLPHTEQKQLPHCGHFPFLTHPHVLSKALKEFLPQDLPPLSRKRGRG